MSDDNIVMFQDCVFLVHDKMVTDTGFGGGFGLYKLGKVVLTVYISFYGVCGGYMIRIIGMYLYGVVCR